MVKRPGVQITPDDVRAASHDRRDWFREEDRLRAHVQIEAAHRMRRSPDLRGWEFGLSMIVGQMGAGKTAFAGIRAAHWYERGHPVFSNAGLLFGRRLTGSALYDAVDEIPHYSLLVVDEAHGILEAKAGPMLGIRGFEILEASLRKKGCQVWLVSAMARMISATSRQECKDIYRPVNFDLPPPDRWELDRPPRETPRNFHMAVEGWHNYPLKRGDLVGAPPFRHNLWQPESMTVYEGSGTNEVRRGMMLSHSWETLDVHFAAEFGGAAAVRSRRAAENGKAAEGKRNDADLREAILEYVLACGPGGAHPRDEITSGEIAGAVAQDVPASKVGLILAGIFSDPRHHKVGRRGRTRDWQVGPMLETLHRDYILVE